VKRVDGVSAPGSAKKSLAAKNQGKLMQDQIQSTEFRETLSAGTSVARRLFILSLCAGFSTAAKEVEGFLLPFK